MSFNKENAVGLQRLHKYSGVNHIDPVENIEILYKKHESLSLHVLLSAGHNLLSASFIPSLKSNLCAALTTQNTTEKNCFILHVENVTALQSNIFLTRMFTGKLLPGFSNAKYCQGQKQTPESLPVPLTCSFCDT